MKSKKIEFDLKITMRSSFHFGGGKGNVGNYSYIQRDAQNRPYWAGGAVKGLIRTISMQLYEAKTDIKCSFSQADVEEGDKCKCVVCDMMGKSGNSRGRLFFSDLVLEENQLERTEYRTGNSIDRYRHVAQDEHLFGIESVSAPDKLVLKGKITGYLLERNFEEQKELLIACLQHIQFIGGNTSRGLGWVEAVDFECVVGQENKTLVSDDIIHHVRLKLMPKSPLLVGKHTSQSNFKDTQLLIPGSVLRAYMAQEIARRCKMEDSQGRINYVTAPTADEVDTPFYTMRKNFANLKISAMMPMGAQTIPLSAVKCKYKNKSSCEHQLWDTLALRLSGSQSNAVNKCPICSERVEKANGLYTTDRNSSIHIITPETMVVTKNAIDRYRRTSKDGMLYNLRLMTPYTRISYAHPEKPHKVVEDLYFTGTISGEMCVKEIAAILGNEIHIGAYQTSGYGSMTAELVFEEIPENLDTTSKMHNRIIAFNQIISELQKQDSASNSSIYIPITLQTDAFVDLIIEETKGRIDDETYLKAYRLLFAPYLEESIIIHSVLAQHESWRGFDTSKSKHYLKKSVPMIRSGAVFVFQVPSLSEKILKQLLQLQKDGICSYAKDTLYAQNGYGQVIVADEFHINNALGK